MDVLSIEIKAKIEQEGRIEQILNDLKADFKGVDHQIDTYFNTKEGRLKLRQGKIENSLISYHREEVKGIKKSVVKLQKLPEDCDPLREILSNQLGVLVTVDKLRKIYFIENVKFHIDEVKGLGSFVEIEALDFTKDKTESELLEQCNYYVELFKIDRGSLLDQSYSDMIKS